MNTFENVHLKCTPAPIYSFLNTPLITPTSYTRTPHFSKQIATPGVIYVVYCVVSVSTAVAIPKVASEKTSTVVVVVKCYLLLIACLVLSLDTCSIESQIYFST